MERLIITVTVGYMLKVLKAKKIITFYKNEFDAIRHGDYIKFIELIKGPIPFMVIYNEGFITSGNIAPKYDDINFALLMKAGPSLKIFYANCILKYGHIEDLEIDTETYEMLALFEINIRMHAANFKLITVDDRLIDVISKLGVFKNISNEDMIVIQKGRKFLNIVKHNKSQFGSWTDRALELKNAFNVLRKYNVDADIF